MLRLLKPDQSMTHTSCLNPWARAASWTAPSLEEPNSPGGVLKDASVLSESQRLKRAAAYHAIDTYVQSGMLVGIGTGDTAEYAIRAPL